MDEQLAGEVRGTVQGTVGGRAEEWKMAEPPGEDQPDATLNPDADTDLSRFGSYIGRVFPGDRDAIEKSARDLEAPDDVLERISRLPQGTTFQNTKAAWEASQAGNTERETP
ncbi:MAG TPA: DUF2795 domain-containing protein [Actinoplanes sp.]|nr:DUF2795 domain-containing protein [Actinoplanes sp.]